MHRLIFIFTLLLPFSIIAADCLPRPSLSLSPDGASLVRVNLRGEPGINYAIERSSDLASWTRIITNRTSTGIFSHSYTYPGGSLPHFFRALSVSSADGLGGAFIFNGTSFTGWEGDTATTFRISDCAIVGGSVTQQLTENRFLCTTRRYTNFILRLDVKLRGTNGFINSGVQFRSERLSGTQQVAGYQADIGEGYWGTLYDESRRSIILAAANQSAVNAVLRTNDWNAYVIRAEGARIRLFLNGLQTVDYTETTAGIPRFGIIGLQVHAGGRSEASYARITLETLP